MTDKELIKKWLEVKLAELYEESQCEVPEISQEIIKGKMISIKESLSFIDSLQEEPVWIKELQDKLDSLSKEDFDKIWAKYDKYDKVEKPVSKVWHDPDEEPEVERTIIWEDEKMMGKHLFQGQWRPKIDVFGRKERWCYLSDILNL